MRLRRFGDRPSLLEGMSMVQVHDRDRRALRQNLMAREELSPGWALGLRKMYKSVADEPMPADFSDLLASLEARIGRGPTH